MAEAGFEYTSIGRRKAVPAGRSEMSAARLVVTAELG